MLTLEDEEKYKQTSSVSIRHGIGDQVVLEGLNRRSTVAEILQQLMKRLSLDDHIGWVIIEKWRGTEKVLPQRTRILRVWHAWCSEQANVEYWLGCQTGSKFNRQHRTRRKKKKEQEDWCDTDSSSDSSESSINDSINTSEESDIEFIKDDNTERQQVIRLLESQSVEIQRNQKQADNLQDALDELDYLRLLESIELAEQQLVVIERQKAELEMELTGFESLLQECDQVPSYNDEEKRNCLHELINKQLVLNKRLNLELEELANDELNSDLIVPNENRQSTDVDADNESSDTGGDCNWTEKSQRLNSFDSWGEVEKSSSSSSDGGGDSGLPGELSEDYDQTRQSSDTGSINTDSALSSMVISDGDQNVDYTRYKTIKKKRLPDWWQTNEKLKFNDSGGDGPAAAACGCGGDGGGKSSDNRMYFSSSHLPTDIMLEAHANNLDLSCDDDAPFGNSEYIRKIRAKNAKMQTNPPLNSKMYRSSASSRRKQIDPQRQDERGLGAITISTAQQRLKRSQSLKTVETLV